MGRDESQIFRDHCGFLQGTEKRRKAFSAVLMLEFNTGTKLYGLVPSYPKMTELSY